MKKIVLTLLTVLLLSATALAADFPDVPRDGSERANAIYKLADAGIVGGYEDGTFRPDRHLTRAELCKIVNLIFGYNMPDTENFKDVKTTDWFHGYVLVAKKAGYIKGFEDNTFRGNTNLTREQTCIIISRTAGLYDLPMTSEIKDKVSDWAVADVKKVIANFIMPLPADGKFRATENITRGELAMALDNFVRAPSTPSEPSTPSFPSFPTTTTYTVKFYDGDDKVISTQTVNKGGNATAPANPEKKDMEYTYTFDKWDTTFTNVQGDLHVRPLYKKTRILYTINLEYGDGTTGEMPKTVSSYYSTELKGILPYEGFSNGTLLFAGWYDGDNLIDNEKFSDLKGDTLTAKWVTTFTVKFYDGYGKVLKTQSVKKGGTATAPTSPKKATDKKFSYVFKKWDKSYKNVESNLDVYPIYEETPIIYTIKLQYGDGATGTLTSEVKVTYDQLLSEVLPTTGFKKEGYAFEGWSYNNALVDGKKYSDLEANTLTAKWTEIYIIKFYDDENGNVISTQSVKKGGSATAPASPTKAADNEYTYSFGGWDKTFTNVSSDLDVYPKFNKTEKFYSVTLDYTTGKTETLKLKYYEAVAPYLPKTVAHDSKIFAGWYIGDELVDNERYCDLKGNTITAKWTDLLFTVQFYDREGGSVISKQSVKKGGSATAPASPTKAADNEYTYSFGGWDKTFTNVSSDLDVYPVFTKTDRTYSVTLDYGNGTTKNVNYTFKELLINKIPTNVENGLKTLLGWYVGDTKIDSHTYEELRPKTITAKWASELIVNFYDASGNVVKTQKVKIGGKATAPSAPKKASTNEYTYSFKGWSENFSKVTENLDVYPVYEENVRYYTVYLSYGEDTTGTMPQSIKVSYSENVADVLPTTGFSNYPFLFDGWYAGGELIDDESYSDLKGDTLTAKWKADPEVLKENKPVIEQMENVLNEMDKKWDDLTKNVYRRVLSPVKTAITYAVADAKAGYRVNKQFVLDNYFPQIKSASDLYHGRVDNGIKTDSDRLKFREEIGSKFTLDTVNYLIDFFDVNIDEHI